MTIKEVNQKYLKDLEERLGDYKMVDHTTRVEKLTGEMISNEVENMGIDVSEVEDMIQ